MNLFAVERPGRRARHVQDLHILDLDDDAVVALLEKNLAVTVHDRHVFAGLDGGAVVAASAAQKGVVLTTTCTINQLVVAASTSLGDAV